MQRNQQNVGATFRTAWHAQRREAALASLDAKSEGPPPEITQMERETAKAHIEHRLRQCLRQESDLVDVPPFSDPAAPAVERLADSALRAEARLLEVQVANAEDRIKDLRVEREVLGVQRDRAVELSAVLEMKLKEAQLIAMRVNDVLERGDEGENSKKESDPLLDADESLTDAVVVLPTTPRGPPPAEEGALPADHKALGLPATLRFNAELGRSRVADDGPQQRRQRQRPAAVVSGGGGGGGDGPSSSESLLPVDVLQGRAALQIALQRSMDAAIVAQYPRVLQLCSEISRVRHQLAFEEQWADDAAVELVQLEQTMAAAKRAEDGRQRQLQQARDALDDAHRRVFQRRKQYILAHKRLRGSAAGGPPSDPRLEQLVQRIREELHAGRASSLNRYCDSELGEATVGGEAAAPAAVRPSPATLPASSWDRPPRQMTTPTATTVNRFTA